MTCSTSTCVLKRSSVRKKFEGYLQSGIRWDKKGRPPRDSWGEKKHDPMKFGPVDSKIPEGFRG